MSSRFKAAENEFFLTCWLGNWEKLEQSKNECNEKTDTKDLYSITERKYELYKFMIEKKEVTICSQS